MRSQVKVLLVMLAIGPIVAWGPIVADRVAQQGLEAMSRLGARGL